MKKHLYVYAAVLGLFASACSSSTPASSAASSAPKDTVSETEQTTMSEGVIDGWQLMEDETVTPEIQAAFDQAVDGLTGVSYTPYLCLAKQMVSGTNYALLCRSVTVTAEPMADYAVVYLYEDMNKKAELLDIVPLEIGSEDSKQGKWEVSESPEIYNELSQVFSKAMEGFTGSNLEPAAYLGWQLVSGTNYAILCRKSIVAPEGSTSWAIVTVYEDLEGKAEIKDIRELEIRMPDKK